jgi:hypothetical protein
VKSNVRDILLPMALVALMGPASPAAAQSPASAASTGTVAAQPPAGQTPAAPAGPILERVRNGFIVAPDVKFTRVDGHDGTLVGGTMGTLVEGRLFLGGGGYWLANNTNDRELAYGGFVGGWYLPSIGILDVSVSGLVGAGRATLAYRFNDPRVSMPVSDAHHGVPRYQTDSNGPSTQFLIAEPTATVTLRVTRVFAVFGSVGYRFIARADPSNDNLAGVSGAVGIRFGQRR